MFSDLYLVAFFHHLKNSKDISVLMFSDILLVRVKHTIYKKLKYYQKYSLIPLVLLFSFLFSVPTT